MSSIRSIRSRSPIIPSVEATPEELSSLTESSDTPPDADGAGLTGKRKERPLPKSRFKMVGNVVLAMQRFKASLNPTITFGKPPSSPGGSSSSLDGSSSDAQPSTNSNVGSSPLRPANAAGASKLRKLQSRNRFATVMQPLPPTDA